MTVPVILVLVLAAGSACSACSASRPLADNSPAATDSRAMKEAAVDANPGPAAAPGEGVAGLPFAHGKRFRTLDEYLDHLERFAAPIDQPWWREIRPGVYEHVKRMPGAPRETATREELLKRFGFSR